MSWLLLSLIALAVCKVVSLHLVELLCHVHDVTATALQGATVHRRINV